MAAAVVRRLVNNEFKSATLAARDSLSFGLKSDTDRLAAFVAHSNARRYLSAKIGNSALTRLTKNSMSSALSAANFFDAFTSGFPEAVNSFICLALRSIAAV